jgi:hypothetical protein
MSATPDFFTRATDQLRDLDGTDTVVLATLNTSRMVMQTRTPRGPAELLHIARRLLEEARDAYDAIERDPPDDIARLHAEETANDIDMALEYLPQLPAED